MMGSLVQLAYIVATGLFVFSLHWLNAPQTPRRGVFAGVAAMLLAVVATWVQPVVVHHGWIILAIIAGFIVGIPLSLVPLTAVPQRPAPAPSHGGPATDRPVPRLRRSRRGAGGHRQVLLVVRRRAGEPDRVPHDGDHRGNHSGVPHLHRQPHGRRQAPGGEVDPAAAGDVPRPECDEHRAPGGGGRYRGVAYHQPHRRAGAQDVPG